MKQESPVTPYGLTVGVSTEFCYDRILRWRSINLGTFEEGNSKNKKNIFPFQGKKQSAQGKRKLVFDQADI